MNYLEYIAHYTDVVMHAYLRYKDYTNYLLYIEPDICMKAIKELQNEAQFGFSVNELKRLLLADGLDRLDERIQIMGWEMTDANYRCMLQIRQSETDFYKERLDFFKKALGDDLGQEYATRLYMTLQAITLNTACIIEMRTKLLGYVNKSHKRQKPTTNADEPQTPEILKHPEIMKEFDKAIQIGLLLDYYTLNPDRKKAPKWLLACFIWGICKHYDISTKAKSGKNKGGFAADWKTFVFIKDAKGKSIDLKLNWQNTKNNNYNPQKLKGFTFWETLCKELDISE